MKKNTKNKLTVLHSITKQAIEINNEKNPYNQQVLCMHASTLTH